MSFKKLIPKKEKEQEAIPSGQKEKKEKLKNVDPNFSRASPHEIASTLAGILTDGDLVKVGHVYVDGLKATQRHWVDEGKNPKTGRALGRWEMLPDWKTRIASANMIAAYKEGLPVQRQVVLSASFDSAEKTIAKIKESPELLKAIQALQGVGLSLENGAGEVIDIDVHKTGPENGDLAPEEP